MAIDFTARWPTPPDAVFVLFTDVALLHDRGIALGAELQEVTVAGTETAGRPGIPSAVSRRSSTGSWGSAVSFLERTPWTPDGDGAYSAALDARAAVRDRHPVHRDRRRRGESFADRRAGATRQLALRREDQLVRRRLAGS